MRWSTAKKPLMMISSVVMMFMVGCGAPEPGRPVQQDEPLTVSDTLKPIHYTAASSLNVTEPEVDVDTYINAMPLSKLGTTGDTALWLNEVLAALGYLPLNFEALGTESLPSTADSQAAIVPSPTATSPQKTAVLDTFTRQFQTGQVEPLQGQWAWNGSYPASLVQLWNPNTVSVVTQGAIMRFEREHGLNVDGIAGPLVYNALWHDLQNQRVSNEKYVYVTMNQTRRERLDIWVDGQHVFSSPANTGIDASPTPSGTWPIYLRFPSQTMQGTSPSGQKYVDPDVPWVNYFYKGCAIHGFPRASYGSRQSLGCIELPISAAEKAYQLLDYGTLVTVTSES